MRRSSPAILLAGVCALVAGLGAQPRQTPQGLQGPQGPQGPQAFRITLPETQQLTGLQPLAISPDGSIVVYAAGNRLYLKPVGDTPATPIAGTELPPGSVAPAFSPDGRSLVFWSAADRTLKRISITGGMPATICPSDPPFGVSWEPNGQIVFGQGQRGVMRVSADGGTPEVIATVPMGEFAYGPHLLPGTQPGSEAVLFTVINPQTAGPTLWDKAQVVVHSLATRQRQVLVEAGSDARYVATGHLVYALAGALMAAPFDLAARRITGPAVQVAGDVRAGGPVGPGLVTVSNSGTLVYVPGQRGRNLVALVDRDGRRQPVGFLPDSVFAPRISPDGRQLAVDDQGSIWVGELANLLMLRRLVTGGPTTGVNQFPLWSSDGQRIVFTSNRDGGVQALFWHRADGTGESELLVKPARSPENWSVPNDRVSYITLKGELDYDIWSYSLKDKTSAPLVETPASAQLSSHFSHDGRWVAYQSNESGRYEIYVQPFPATGTKVQITRDGGTRPMWSLDDREIIYDSNATQLFSAPIQMQAARQTLTAGAPVALPITGFVQAPMNSRRVWDMTPDGRQFLMMFRTPPQIDVVVNWTEDLRRRVPAR